jgi:hypothetical protein
MFIPSRGHYTGVSSYHAEIPTTFRVIFEIIRCSLGVYVFITRFLAEPQAME